MYKFKSKKLCDDPNCERIKIGLNAIRQFEFKIKDKEALQCVKSSLENIKKTNASNCVFGIYKLNSFT
jgi:hypothetical protein